MLLLLAVGAVAQGAAPGTVSVQRLKIVRDSADVRVEITLTAPIDGAPTVSLANHPDRLVLDLPNTLSNAKQEQVSVNYKGVRRIRLGLNSAAPPVTRVVVDLDQTHPYVLRSDGNRVMLIVSAPSSTIAGAGHGAQAAGVSAGIAGIFRRRSAPPPMSTGNESATGLPTPPPPGAPITFPEEPGRTAASSTSASTPSRPDAAHPDRGSLQEGTVFPGLGSPGAGNVPSAKGGTSTASTAGTVPGSSQSSGGTRPPDSLPGSPGAGSSFPSAVVTPPSQPNSESARVSKSSGPALTSPRVSPMIVTPVAEPKSEAVSLNSPSAVDKPTRSNAAPMQPKTEPGAEGSQPVVVATGSSEAQKSASIAGPQPASQPPVAPATETSIATPAPEAKSGSVSVNRPSEPSRVSTSTPPAEAPAQPKAGPAMPSSQTNAAVAASSLEQADAAKSRTIAELQPQGQTTSAPSNLTSPTEAGGNASEVTPTAAVTTAEPAPLTAAITPKAATEEPAGDADLPVLAIRAVDPNLRTVFKVKYVAQGVAYLDGGRSAGLTEGMKLEIRESDLPAQQGSTAEPTDPREVAELEVTDVAETSAATDIRLPKRPVKPGDLAYLSSGDAQTLVQQRALSATRKYPAVVTFTEGNPLEEEARAEVPRPPQPSVNRARGRIGFDYMGTVSRGTSSLTSSDIGMIVRADITRLNGTYWNVSGYWRGRLNSLSSTGQQTLQDLINRTYHLSMTYDNPNSAWVAGFGRLYLPWASSLDTIDGGYFGRRMAPGITAGIFAGTTPDPTSWDYNPDRRIGGTFVNFQGGSFDGFHYTSTTGLGVSMLKWQIDRPFVFLENTFSYKRYLSIYHSLQADSPAGNPAVPAPGPGFSRSFLTLRLQPHPRLELDFNHNYFRDVPTFDPQLIGTGLLDKYLFQGFSAGARVEVVKQIFVYGTLGQSNRTGDPKTSLNQMYGVTFNRLPWLGLRADGHYSRFSSSFGSGSYRAVSLSRNFSDDIRLEVLAGDQTFNSLLTTNDRSRFVNTNIDFALGAHYFTQGGFTINRGQLSYDQWMFTLGYRFDSKGKHQQ